MRNYELVLLLDALLNDNDRKAVLGEIEKTLEKNILQKDEIGILSTSYAIKTKSKTKNDKSYFVSYHLSASNEDLLALRKLLVYNKGVNRYYIYSMTKTQPFYLFADLQEKMNKIISERAEKKHGQKISFFTNRDNATFINRKATPMFKKYMTRFGDIKPRKYTKNPVTIQKALRKEILRARELGLLEYIK